MLCKYVLESVFFCPSITKLKLSYLEKKKKYNLKKYIFIRIKPTSIPHTAKTWIAYLELLVQRFDQFYVEQIWNMFRLQTEMFKKDSNPWIQASIQGADFLEWPCYLWPLSYIFCVCHAKKNQNVRSKSQIAAVTETFFRTPSSWPQHVKTKLS